MVEIRGIVYTQKFEHDVRKIRGNSLKEKLEKIRKIAENPEFGKPLRYGLKGEWTIRVEPYRSAMSTKNRQIRLYG